MLNQQAVINNTLYTFDSQLENVITHRPMIICKDDQGKKFICDIDTWTSCAYTPVTRNTAADITRSKFNKYASPEEKIALFRSLFVAREDVYAKRYYNTKTGQSGYVPACANEWRYGVCDKKAYRCAVCPNRSFMKITDKIIYAHLKGDDEFFRDVVGTYALFPDETTKFLAIDFDKESWQEDVTAVVSVYKEHHIPASVERSRSGNGAHIWFFLRKISLLLKHENLAAAFSQRLWNSATKSSFRRMTECSQIRILCQRAALEILSLCRFKGVQESRATASL